MRRSCCPENVSINIKMIPVRRPPVVLALGFVFALALGLTAVPASAQISAFPMPFVEPQFFNTNGSPCSGCKLQTWSAGTTTPLATFTDSTSSTPNSNPVILDAGGRANVWLSSFAYKMQLQTAGGAPIWTVDNVVSANFPFFASISSSAANPATAGFIRMANGDQINWRPISGTGNIGFSQGGAGSTATGGLADVVRYGTAGTGGIQAQRFLDFNGGPAATGVLACSNNALCVTARNGAGTSDVTAIQVDPTNVTRVGGSAGVSFGGAGAQALTTSASTGSGSIVLASGPTISGATLSNGPTLSGTTTINGPTNITGATTISGATTMSGPTTLNGTTTIPASQTLAVNGSVSGSSLQGTGGKLLTAGAVVGTSAASLCTDGTGAATTSNCATAGFSQILWATGTGQCNTQGSTAANCDSTFNWINNSGVTSFANPTGIVVTCSVRDAAQEASGGSGGSGETPSVSIRGFTVSNVTVTVMTTEARAITGSNVTFYCIGIHP